MLKRSHYIGLALVVLVALLILNLPSKTTARMKLVIGSLFVPLFGLEPALFGEEFKNTLFPVEHRLVREHLELADRAASALENLPMTGSRRLILAEEQAAWFHLLRLSYGEGRNFCRVAKKDLVARLRLSERRLLRVLDALVAKGFARPLHRDNRGTLWRVALPCEAFGEPIGDDVLVGRATELRVVRGPPGEPCLGTAVHPERSDGAAAC